LDWQNIYGDKLASAEEAMGRVRSGDTVGVATYTSTPLSLCRALLERGKRGELKNVRIEHPAPMFEWSHPEAHGAFELCASYLTPQVRAASDAGEMEFLPAAVWKTYDVPSGMETHPDVFLVPVSPPDANGYCSFGAGVWMSATLARNAKLVIAEVRPDFIRTYGENFIHIDQIDLLVEAEEQPEGALATPERTEEEVAAVEVICSLVAAELVKDRDTLQIGVGTVSSAFGLYLDAKNDLGIHTEVLTGGIVDLVKKGVVTGKYKTLHPYKVVASAIAALDRTELEAIHMNPVFELYDFGYTDDLRHLVRFENFVAVNNSLLVDLSGQVAAESLDHRMYSGVGGQAVFMIAGAYSPGGASVSVLPSSSVPSSTGERVSRIVPVLPPGCGVTVPRTFVDYVVTEHGIATLRGKTMKQRARELAAVSHPDMRPELEKQAAQLYGA
jgi:4-hydroxybutyrate CoA-transferase